MNGLLVHDDLLVNMRVVDIAIVTSIFYFDIGPEISLLRMFNMVPIMVCHIWRNIVCIEIQFLKTY